ncbi:MAG: hypothetical protein AAFY41_01980, partial [Bacteroidota bacterium]
MTYKNILLLFLLSTTFSGTSQIHIGYYHDLDGLPVHDFIHPFVYSPKKKLRLTHYSTSYEKGKVYFNDGRIESGLIKYENKRIWFKQTANDEKLKVKPEETIALTVGIDSFFVAKNFYVERQLVSLPQEKPQFMQYVTAFDGKIYAKHYFFSSGLGGSSIIETYQVQKKGDTHWTSFPRNNKRFKPIALQYFGHIPYLNRKIEDGSISHNDIMTLIKSAEYYEKLQQNESLFFDKYWNETKEDGASYQANIRSLENDSIWTVDYYKDNLRIYRARYHSLYPNKKHGVFEIFDSSGNTVASIDYNKNDVSKRNLMFPNNKPHYTYHFEEMSPGYKPY